MFFTGAATVPLFETIDRLLALDVGGFSLGNIDQYESVAALYRQLHGYLDAYYWKADNCSWLTHR